MAFQLSPGVLVTETDLTGIVPAVASSIGGYVGPFQWGPVEEITTVSNESELVSLFGKPNDTVASSFFSAANFLGYSNNLKVVRVVNSTQSEATPAAGNATTYAKATFNGSTAVSSANDTITLTSHGWETGTPVFYNDGGGTAPGSLTSGTVYYVIKQDSNTIKLATSVSNADAGTAVDIASGGSGTAHTLTPYVLIKNSSVWEDSYSTGSGRVGAWAAKYPGALGNSLGVAIADASTFSGWAYDDDFDGAPATSSYVSTLGGSADEMHIVVVDQDGLWTGTAGTVLEKFAFVSKAADAKKSDGTNNYYVEVLKNSKYIWWMDHQASSNWGSSAEGITFTAVSSNALVSLSGGVSKDSPTDAQIITGWDLFDNAETIDVNLLINGPHSMTVAADLITTASTRLDCVAFVSPLLSSVYNKASGSAAATAVTTDRDTLTSTSYAVMDSGWKYQYDKYNDKYRWIPLNADVAGLCARTDDIADPWFSPGGLNRGQIKNVVKLAWSPTKSERDTLYKKGVNPVVTFPGEGTVLYGDKTLLSKPSAFDRINVRRLFIVLEKAIATAGKYQLFEFNDAFTRAQFRNLVEPFLRDIRGRRGIYDFRVVCDETNNTGEVIDRNEFVADIYIKPARSINFMQLNFIATRTGVSFEEVAGA